MASKGKSKLKKGETKFESKCIDLKRFAFDVIVYSVSKFEVPKNCICKWEGSENDYGCPDFLLVLSRLIFEHQIALRYRLHLIFNSYYKSNKLESFKGVSDLFQYLIKKSTWPVTSYVIEDVERSLSISCELILFLYSKSLNLYLKELAGYWFDCYFHIAKKKFEKEGGLDFLYKKANIPNREHFIRFYNTFISVHCLPYEVSAENEQLEGIFYQSIEKRMKKIVKAFSSKEREEREKLLMQHCPRVGYRTESLIEVCIPLLTSRLNEASGIDVPENPGLGIPPHEELLRVVGGGSTGDATLSQNLPGTSSQKPPKHRRGSSARTKRSSGKKPNVSVTDEATPSQNLPGATPQETAKNGRVLSGKQKTESSLCSSMEQGLGQLSLDSPGTKQSSERGKKPMSR